MVQILFTVFGMGYIYENAQIIDNHGTLLHTTVLRATVYGRIWATRVTLYEKLYIAQVPRTRV